MITRQLVGASMCIGILVGIGIDLYNRVSAETFQSEFVYVAEAKEIEPEVIQIKIKIDWTEEKIEQRIRDTFNEDPELAVAIAKSESGENLKADAYNPEWHYDKNGKPLCKGSYGILQIGCVHMMENPEALFDVELNLKIGRKLYEERGWEPWGGYTSGGYKKHL